MFAERTNWNLTQNRLSEALEKHRAAGKPLLDLTASNPTTCGFEYNGVAILEALRNPDALVYEPNPRGLESARRAVTAYYAPSGASVAVEDILLTTSTSEAYSFVFRLLCNPGDELLIPAPSYPLFDFLAGIQDVKLVHYPLVYDHGWQIDFHSLEQAASQHTRGIIVVHPNNPTGQFTKPHEIRRLNEICSARRLALIADEVFLDFSLTRDPPASFVLNREVLTFTLSGLSKISGLPQMKAAWLTVSGPEPMKSAALARLEVLADTYLSMNAPVQLAIPVFLEQRHKFQQQVMARARRNLEALDRQLAMQKSSNRLAVEAGWSVVLRAPETVPEEELVLDLLTRNGVLVHPGHFYELPCQSCLVASLITPEEEFQEGTKRLLSRF
jgi:alanine-synthesizing transaminase